MIAKFNVHIIFSTSSICSTTRLRIINLAVQNFDADLRKDFDVVLLFNK